MPTEGEAKETIKKIFTETYSSDYGMAKVTKLNLNIGGIKFGNLTKKQVEYGKDAQPVCPAKVIVAVDITYSDGTHRNVERGQASDDDFLFYKDGFDHWTFKTGTP